jgi:hypothetical protein
MQSTCIKSGLYICGDGIRAKVLGNAPFGFYKFTFPRKLQEKLGYKGQKVDN